MLTELAIFLGAVWFAVKVLVASWLAGVGWTFGRRYALEIIEDKGR